MAYLLVDQEGCTYLSCGGTLFCLLNKAEKKAIGFLVGRKSVLGAIACHFVE